MFQAHQIWIHAVWYTNNYDSALTPPVNSVLVKFLRDQLIEAGCQPKAVNSNLYAVHCLFNLNVEISINRIMQQLKGRSAVYLNSLKILPEKFEWMPGHCSFTVGPEYETHKDYINIHIDCTPKKDFKGVYEYLTDLLEERREDDNRYNNS